MLSIIHLLENHIIHKFSDRSTSSVTVWWICKQKQAMSILCLLVLDKM